MVNEGERRHERVDSPCSSAEEYRSNDSPRHSDYHRSDPLPLPPQPPPPVRSELDLRAALGLSLRRDGPIEGDLMVLAKKIEELMHRIDKFDGRLESRLEFWQRKQERSMEELAPKEVFGRLRNWVPEVDDQLWLRERQCRESMEAYHRLQATMDHETKRLEYFMNMYSMDIKKVQCAIAEQDCRIEQLAMTVNATIKGDRSGINRVMEMMASPQPDSGLPPNGDDISNMAQTMLQRGLPDDEKLANFPVRALKNTVLKTPMKMPGTGKGVTARRQHV